MAVAAADSNMADEDEAWAMAAMAVRSNFNPSRSVGAAGRAQSRAPGRKAADASRRTTSGRTDDDINVSLHSTH